MPKIVNSIRFDPETLNDIDKIAEAGGRKVTLSSIVRDGTKAEVQRLKKLYGIKK
jgi:hypothetical protein